MAESDGAADVNLAEVILAAAVGTLDLVAFVAYSSFDQEYSEDCEALVAWICFAAFDVVAAALCSGEFAFPVAAFEAFVYQTAGYPA